MRPHRLATLLWTALVSVNAIPLETADAPADIGLLTDHPPETEESKYFHEPGDDGVLGHYDARYFHGAVSYDQRTDTLHHMIRAYVSYFREIGLETWIAHGTLLGWWWNGHILPWDWDLDTQVSGATLEHLAKNYNHTIHHYVSEDNTVTRDYLLDVNPSYVERDRGEGWNIIDARWIDIRNGLYIDITGLSETQPANDPGIWICKNFHRYRIKDLYPMRESLYEGVPVLIPYAYDRILVEEYEPKSLVVTEFEGHTWNPQKKLWVKNSTYGRNAAKFPSASLPRSKRPGLKNLWQLSRG